MSSDEVMVNGEIIDGADVMIRGTDDNIVISISSLEVKMTAQDDYFIAAGETLSGQSELGEKELIFTQNWDFKYGGFIGEDNEFPQVYITAIIKTGTKPALPLEISTDENAVCSYSLGGDYQEMETTGAKVHTQNLFDLEDGNDYEVSVQCVDESGNTNTEVLNFHFGEVPESAEEPLPQAPAPTPSGGGGSSSKPKVSAPIVVSQSEEDEEIDDIPEEEPSLTNTAKSIQRLSELPAEVSLGKGEKASFTIGDNDYGVWADKIDGGSLFLTINSKPEPTVAVLKLSESRNFDLNGDGDDDISISLTETDGLKAYLRIANIKPSLSSRLTAAVVGVAENGSLIYVAGLVLIVFSLVGIKIYYTKKN